MKQVSPAWQREAFAYLLPATCTAEQTEVAR
jgi:hypothetical protein